MEPPFIVIIDGKAIKLEDMTREEAIQAFKNLVKKREEKFIKHTLSKW